MNKFWIVAPVIVGLNITNVNAALYDFDSGLGDFQVFGDTTSVSNAARLTTATIQSAGSLFLNNTINATRFNASFDILIANGTGADGLTFAWVESAGLGTAGGHFGFTGLQGYYVEFDTYLNGDDISENHIGINHNTISSLSAVTVPELEDTGWHHIDIAFDSGQIQVSMDSIQYIDYLISGYSGFDAYFGFTAGTGSITNEHFIDNFSLTTGASVPAPAVVWLLCSGLVGLIGMKKRPKKYTCT